MIEAAVTGRLGQPPQYRTSSGGKRWATLSLAVGSGEEIEWVQVAIFEPLLEEVPPDLEKGEKLYVEGKLKLNRWEGSEGLRSNLQVAASRILVLDRIGRRRKPVRRKEADEVSEDTLSAAPTVKHQPPRRADCAAAMPNDPVPF